MSCPDEDRVALVVGAAGVTSRATCEEFLAVDTTDADVTTEALVGLPVSQVFLTAWSGQDNEERNIAVNSAIVRNGLASTGRAGAPWASAS